MFIRFIMNIYFFIILLICLLVNGANALDIVQKKYKITITDNPWKMSIYKSDNTLIVEEPLLDDNTQRPLSYYSNGWQYIEKIEKIERNGNVYNFICSTTDNRETLVVLKAKDNMLELSFRPPKGTHYIKEVLTGGAQYNSHYYGFGQRFNSLDQRGSTIEMWNIDQPKTFGTSSYINVPFFFEIVNEGGVLPGSLLESRVLFHTYGFYLKDTSKSTFKMSSDMRRAYSITLNNDRMNYVIFIGESPKEILKSYVELTGLPELPPSWVFAPWKSRDNYYSVNDVLEDVDTMRRLDIPMSVIVIDSPWETAYNDFYFNEVQFPNYQNMIEYIHRMGNKLVLWITPFTNVISNIEVEGQKPEATNFAEADKNGYFVKDEYNNTLLIDWWKGTGGAIDFTNKEAALW